MKSIGLAIKRLCDIIVALGGIIILSPVLLVCMILIKCKLGSPIFFKQRRIGKNNKEFEKIIRVGKILIIFFLYYLI